ncbi:hypothetical protein [Montanilutibacter psychrotolerans]|uniref:hypothetical protein n=1 Tax=Montanilutibacter psychrotolerans TaxID=1327343 RepID=UPI001681B0C7|nr:hypothetical protein [Lysobacter psychrotolerans]
MNHDTPFPEALRWRLREMRRDAAPATDLWPGIAARLQPPGRVAAIRRQSPLAIAASLLLAVGLVAGLNQERLSPTAASQASLVQREADGMARHYQAALREIPPAQVPSSLRPAFDDLDRSVVQIRAALVHEPDSLRLLEQLRRTYDRRLALAQRVAYS